MQAMQNSYLNQAFKHTQITLKNKLASGLNHAASVLDILLNLDKLPPSFYHESSEFIISCCEFFLDEILDFHLCRRVLTKKNILSSGSRIIHAK